jgi:hypothetical protein
VTYLRRFAGFWWSFLVGDDVPLALGVGAAIGLTAGLHAAGLNDWWLLPPAVIALLALSVARVARVSYPRLRGGRRGAS